MPATTPESPIRPRYHMLDAVRGFVLVHMVAFHFCFDWFVLFAGQADWPTLPAVFWWERFICCTFNLVSGMAFHLGRRHLYHSLLLNAVGTGVTAVTLLIMPEQAVWFGVLSLLGCATLLTHLAEPVLKKLPPVPGAGLSLWLFWAAYPAQQGWLRLWPGLRVNLPGWLYASRWTAVLGFPPAGFYSSDYFPLLPWLFLFWVGIICGCSSEAGSRCSGRFRYSAHWGGCACRCMWCISRCAMGCAWRPGGWGWCKPGGCGNA